MRRQAVGAAVRRVAASDSSSSALSCSGAIAATRPRVVARMVAEPATADYGRLTVMLQARFRATRLFVIPPGAFRPPPQVDSAFVRLVPLREARPAIAEEALFARVVAAAFGQRRKTLRNALAAVTDDARLRDAGIDPSARGETLAVADFVRLANMLAAEARG